MLISLKRLFFTLIFIFLYAYVFGVLLIIVTDGVTVLLEISNPVYILQYVYRYVKWLYQNHDHLGYGIILKVLFALFLPSLLYGLLRRIKWIQLLRRSIKKISQKIKVALRKSLSSYSQNGFELQPEEIIIIKNAIMQDMEQIIDRRLHAILELRKERIAKSKIAKSKDE